jgi:hypothetical protein
MMYNFGNIVCWRADGSLDSFGRMDDQVKIKVCVVGIGYGMDKTDFSGIPGGVGWRHSCHRGKVLP